MNNNYLTVEQFNQFIQQWSGKTIKITKQELGDQDSIIMKLDDISYHKDTRRIDDYEPMHSIHLIGEGTTEIDAQGGVPLPASSYEIPLEDTTQYQFDDIRFSLVTERGTYTIELYG
ncbi:hypothetical protein [Alkalihalobacillus sp. TS-13]|uniref:hypothetical protein n=1 Tax=Alkalihalobacillus sp. TS-13 TaxID=2842455 RepID=UPI001C88BF59|nr:hypothetical protein [Alkalihalobacillus sp. TS-13]